MKFLGLLFLSFASLTAAEEPCPFCEIAAGQREASMVWRDENVMAFMTTGPRNPGHGLVVPAKHSAGILDLPPADAHRMTDLARRIARAIKRTDLTAEGFTFKMNTGPAAGQTVFHAHMHVIPRFAAEPAEPAKGSPTSKVELNPIAGKIREQLDKN